MLEAITITVMKITLLICAMFMLRLLSQVPNEILLDKKRNDNVK